MKIFTTTIKGEHYYATTVERLFKIIGVLPGIDKQTAIEIRSIDGEEELLRGDFSTDVEEFLAELNESTLPLPREIVTLRKGVYQGTLSAFVPPWKKGNRQYLLEIQSYIEDIEGIDCPRITRRVHLIVQSLPYYHIRMDETNRRDYPTIGRFTIVSVRKPEGEESKTVYFYTGSTGKEKRKVQGDLPSAFRSIGVNANSVPATWDDITERLLSITEQATLSYRALYRACSLPLTGESWVESYRVGSQYVHIWRANIQNVVLEVQLKPDFYCQGAVRYPLYFTVGCTSYLGQIKKGERRTKDDFLVDIGTTPIPIHTQEGDLNVTEESLQEQIHNLLRDLVQRTQSALLLIGTQIDRLIS